MDHVKKQIIKMLKTYQLIAFIAPLIGIVVGVLLGVLFSDVIEHYNLQYKILFWAILLILSSILVYLLLYFIFINKSTKRIRNVLAEYATKFQSYKNESESFSEVLIIVSIDEYISGPFNVQDTRNKNFEVEKVDDLVDSFWGSIIWFYVPIGILKVKANNIYLVTQKNDLNQTEKLFFAHYNLLAKLSLLKDVD